MLQEKVDFINGQIVKQHSTEKSSQRDCVVRWLQAGYTWQVGMVDKGLTQSKVILHVGEGTSLWSSLRPPLCRFRGWSLGSQAWLAGSFASLTYRV